MLARIRKSMEEKDQGFTLIELLVVMIIIGILAAIAIPVFLNQRKKAVDSSMKSDLRTVANEMETYYADQQAYTTPTGTTGSVVLGSDTVRLSTGNTIAVNLNTASAATAFCVSASNTSGSHTWVYISSQGGLQGPSVTTCPATGATTGW
jgi:prepilin-type N-terminal cleavage/methylation domain-containing protein